MVWGLWFGVWGSGFRAEGDGFRVWDLVSWVWTLGFGMWGAGSWVWSWGSRVEGCGFRQPGVEGAHLCRLHTHTLAHTFSLTPIHTRPLYHTHTHTTLSLSHTHAHTHTHTHTHEPGVEGAHGPRAVVHQHIRIHLPNRLFQIFDSYRISPESDELWYTSGQLKKTV